MAVGTPARVGGDGPGGGEGSASAPATRRPRANFETWSWLFMRVSGLVLLFLALIHFSITHILHDVTETRTAFVQARWQNPLWRVFDWALLALGLLHGVNGVRWSIDDYCRRPAVRAAVKSVLYSVTALLFLYGTITVVTFNAASPGR